MKVYLPPQSIVEAQILHSKQVAKSLIALYFKEKYKVNRTTVYRHLNTDPTKYKNPPIDRPESTIFMKSKPNRYFLIQWAKGFGYTSIEVTEATGWTLKEVNRLWI